MKRLNYFFLIGLIGINCNDVIKTNDLSNRFNSLPDSLASRFADSIAVSIFKSISMKDKGFPIAANGEKHHIEKKFFNRSGDLVFYMLYVTNGDSVTFKDFAFFNRQLIRVKIRNSVGDSTTGLGYWFFRNGNLLFSDAQGINVTADDLFKEGNRYLTFANRKKK